MDEVCVVEVFFVEGIHDGEHEMDIGIGDDGPPFCLNFWGCVGLYGANIDKLDTLLGGM